MQLDAILERNRAFVRGREPRPLPAPESLDLAVVGCFDPRLDDLLLPALGLRPGEALVFRVPGAFVPPESSLLRSLTLGVLLNGVTEVAVVGHTTCRMASFSTDAFITAFRHRGVPREAFGHQDLRQWAGAIPSPRQGVQLTVAAILSSPCLPKDLVVWGAILDDTTGALEIVHQPGDPLAITAPLAAPLAGTAEAIGGVILHPGLEGSGAVGTRTEGEALDLDWSEIEPAAAEGGTAKAPVPSAGSGAAAAGAEPAREARRDAAGPQRTGASRPTPGKPAGAAARAAAAAAAAGKRAAAAVQAIAGKPDSGRTAGAGAATGPFAVRPVAERAAAQTPSAARGPGATDATAAGAAAGGSDPLPQAMAGLTRILASRADWSGELRALREDLRRPGNPLEKFARLERLARKAASESREAGQALERLRQAMASRKHLDAEELIRLFQRLTGAP